MFAPKAALTRQFLTWVATVRPTDTEVLDAWPSSCPHLAIWEDALADGLVAFDGSRARHVVLTEAGRRIVAPAGECRAVPPGHLLGVPPTSRAPGPRP